MRDFIYSVMTDYTNLIIFIHVLSSVIWLGMMITLKVVSKQSTCTLEIQHAFIKKVFTFSAPFILLLFISALFMALGYKDNALDSDGFILDAHTFESYKYIHTKGSIWTLMLMNMVLMTWINMKIDINNTKNIQKSQERMWIINTYLLPINIILGTVEIYIGVFLRHSF